MWADMVLDEFRACDVRRCVFEHFGVLRGSGLLPQELATGTDGRIPVAGGSDQGRGGGGGRRGGRMGPVVEDDRATVASWGAVSRPSTRLSSSAGSTRARVRSSRR